MARDELARLEWEIQREQARFGGPSAGDGDEPLEADPNEELSLGELLLGGALVGLVILALVGIVAVVVGALRLAVKGARRRP